MREVVIKQPRKTRVRHTLYEYTRPGVYSYRCVCQHVQAIGRYAWNQGGKAIRTNVCLTRVFRFLSCSGLPD